jgi:hypothetical protein
MNVCTILSSGPLEANAFLFLVGMGMTAIALSFRPAAKDEAPAAEAITA